MLTSKLVFLNVSLDKTELLHQPAPNTQSPAPSIVIHDTPLANVEHFRTHKAGALPYMLSFILKIYWQDRIPKLEVLERAYSSGIECMLIKAQL
ncbi:hypothetical protein ElyMa_003950600 [Elysia marginata]|uniref:Uncharacterized protein n=1 Tax=Elysia marginata TaxID=1093978 RepID=A0AAV4FTC7_9GAST|nr:hypothetical protein ElyMa_003950600 [Elysia marginata]